MTCSPRSLPFPILFATGLLVASISHHAQAQVASWATATSGFYDDPANWDPTGLPALTDTVVFAKPGSYDIGFSESHGAENFGVANGANVDFVVAGADTATRLFRISGNGSVDEARLRLLGSDTGPRLNVVMTGDLDLFGGSNTLKIEGNAALLNRSSMVNVNGIVPVTGGSARWSMSGDLNLRGGAFLSVVNGGTVVAQDDMVIGGTSPSDLSNANVFVSGPGADDEPATIEVGDDMYVGNFGETQFSVRDGGVVDVASSVQVAFGAASEARILVDGVDSVGNPSVFNTGLLTLGRGGRAELNIGSGGIVNSDSVTVGDSSESYAFVSGGEHPTLWNIAGDFRMSTSAFGQVVIDQGAKLQSNRAFIGLGTSTTGLALFSLDGEAGDPTTEWQNQGDVYVGGNASSSLSAAVLEIRGNSLLEAGGTFTIWSSGNVTLQAGGKLAAGTIDDTNGGLFDFQDGTLSTGRFEGDLTNAVGILSPGFEDSAAATLITGDYDQQTDGKMSIGVGGVSPGGTHDLINVLGNASLDGILELSLLNNFTPDASHVFTIFAADTLVGFFDNVNSGQRLDTADGRGSFVVHYGIGSAFDETRVILTDYEPSGILPGDYNQDGVVDLSDYTVWRNHLGAAAGTLANDVDGGVIGTAQFQTWRANYGLSNVAPVTSSAVPEPSSVILILCAGAFCIPIVRSRLELLSTSKYQLICGVTTLCLCISSTAEFAFAGIRTWSPQGGSNDWNTIANWTPAGPPGSGDDVIIDVAFPSPSLATGDSAPLSGIRILSGGRLFTGGRQLTVDNATETADVIVTGSGSSLVIDMGSPTGRDASIDMLDITVGAELKLAGGTLEIDRELLIDQSSRITGNGTVQVNQADPNDPSVLTINGSLRPSGGRGLYLSAPAGTTATIGGNGIFAQLDAGFGDLTINAELEDRILGVLTVGAGRAIRFDQPASLDESTVLHLRGSTTSQATLLSDNTNIWGRVNITELTGMSGVQQFREISEVNLPDPEDRLVLRGGTLVMGEGLNATDPGAKFTGQGVIVNESASALNLVSSVTLDAELVNSGVVNAASIAFISYLEVGNATFSDYTQTASGELHYDIGELNGSVVRDSFRANGTVHLDGMLKVDLVELLNGDLPTLTVGDSFPIISAAGGVFGRFSETDLPNPPAGAIWEVNYFPEAVSIDLVATTGVNGDYNNDGSVDLADYTVWRNNLGASPGTLPNDNVGGVIGVNQYAAWKSNFGASMPLSSVATSTVPEPSTWIMLSLISVTASFRIRRSRRR